MDNALLPLVDTYGLDVTKSVTTRANRSATAAYNDYRENQRPKLYDLRTDYPRQSYNRALNTLNYQYGYSPVNYSIWLKRMKTEKHPDFKMWNDACQATETLFKAFKYNKSIDAYQAKFEPIISYFRERLESIPEKDKKAKNMKKAAFDNLTNILFYLDRYDEVIAVCETYLEDKYLDKKAKRMRDKANRQKQLMAFHKVDSCHLENMKDIDDSDIESEEEVADSEDEG